MVKITDMSKYLDLTALKANYDPYWIDQSMMPGKAGTPIMAGVWERVNGKGFVYYPKKAFDAAGYKVPTTMAELQALEDQMVKDGSTPWCIGIESGAATGWVATDWIENNLLDEAGPDTYDKWVNHDIPFNDPAVKTAAQNFESLVLANGNVLGGRKQTVSTAFATSANPMFDNPPKCFLHRQGNFITQAGFFPAKVVADIDNQVGVFQYPGQTADSKPMLGGGDLAAVFNGKDDDTKQVMAFLTGKDYPGWSEQAGFLSPRKDYPLTNYKSKLTQQIAQLGQQSTVFRFDGSDQMPGAVGSGSFWKGMVAWVSGQKDLDTTLSDIQSSWPS